MSRCYQSLILHRKGAIGRRASLVEAKGGGRELSLSLPRPHVIAIIAVPTPHAQVLKWNPAPIVLPKLA
jgi:hypothetical protein